MNTNNAPSLMDERGVKLIRKTESRGLSVEANRETNRIFIYKL